MWIHGWRSERPERSLWALAILCGLGLIFLVLGGCERKNESPPPVPAQRNPSPSVSHSAGTLDLVLTFGSEKKSWINQVTAEFNRAKHKTADGRVIVVSAIPMGSGECVDEVLTGRREAHLISPASEAFIKLGNADSRAQTGKDLVGPTEQLVLSPVVLAMWKPMAQALGWPNKPIGWADVLAMANTPDGWASKGQPQWGAFKLGHTHPEYSNSGLISALAIVYAGAGKTSGLTLEDVKSPQTPAGALMSGIEKAVVHYGSSTGFFADRMFAGGPGYLSTAVLYESSVIESYGLNTPTSFPVVAVYPKEGTFWSDHPVGIVQRPWVTEAHDQAAKQYIRFLRDRPQQEKAMQHGFRPAEPAIALGAPIDSAHGVDPGQPQNVLPVPESSVTKAVIDLWKATKKQADVVLVMDVSGSMNDDQKIVHARTGALELVNMLGPQDTLSVLAFNNRLLWSSKAVKMESGREQLRTQVQNLIANNGTALYDATAAAHGYLKNQPASGRISAVIVLSDGADTASQMTLQTLLTHLRGDGESQAIRVFTIGYGKDANEQVLKAMSDQTQAKYFKGTTQNIREVFKDISTFF